MSRFVAIDFETASYCSFSACAVAIVTMENHIVTDRYYTLIQPPNNYYIEKFCELHGIYPKDTLNAPNFYDIASDIINRLQDEVVVAHNEGFDRQVLKAALAYYDLSASHLRLDKKWECTVKIYRKKGFKKANLKACCEQLDIPLNHHNALSDAEACATLYDRHLRNF